MNRVVLMGRLTREPDVRYTQGENSMCIVRYTLAVDRRFSRGAGNDGNSADFIPCVVFGRSAEFAEKYLHKGTKIAVSGRIQTGSYTNRDGQKVYTTEVVVEDQEFAESRNASGGGNYGGQGGYNGGSQGGYRGGQSSYRDGGQGGYNSGSQGGYNAGQGSSYNGGGQSDFGSNAGAQGNAGSAPQDAGGEDSLDGFMNLPDGIDEELPFG
ncbi:MAG: single-stranded DNA-binding protein [Eubacteriales bacterium]|nr:single-stranded DNA-binding protein [Eubacteriales bacterium]